MEAKGDLRLPHASLPSLSFTPASTTASQKKPSLMFLGGVDFHSFELPLVNRVTSVWTRSLVSECMETWLPCHLLMQGLQV